MKFVEIVEMVSDIESKCEHLTDAKLELLEAILTEGSETSFDLMHHIDYLVEFVSAYSDKNARTITESVNCGKVLDVVLQAVQRNTRDMNAFVTEALNGVGEIDVELSQDETKSVTLLSIVTNALTEMYGISEVENMPAEMIFDIVNEVKNLKINDETDEMDLSEIVEEISEALKSAIRDGSIDFDTDNYTGETLSEFLDDYTDTADLLEEMAKVNEETLSESKDKDGVRLMKKAKDASMLIESKYKNCAKGDVECMKKKAKAAKEWYSKHEMPGGVDVNKVNLIGRLGAHIRVAKKAFKKFHGKDPTPDLIQYVWVPGIIKRMRMKNAKLKGKAMIKKQGMK
jgi:hypothetical protein